MSSPAIEVTSLNKRFADFQALQDVSFSVPQHSVVGFLGPNGAGKTTTLRVIAGLSKATSGTVKVNGNLVSFGQPSATIDLGYLPEQPAFYNWMSGREYLHFIGGLSIGKVSDLPGRIKQVIETVGLTSARNRRISGYSNGMKQRLGIAQAVLNNPAVLIFDEPVSALDPIGRRDILQLMQELKKNHTILFSSHILSDVERLCEEVIVINKGQIVTQSAVSTLKNEFAKPLMKVTFARQLSDDEFELLIKKYNLTITAQAGDSIEILVQDEKMLEQNSIIETLLKLGVPIVSCGYEKPGLEDIFVNLVTQKNDE
jgi:ABC-2 type transport system ATP-binding protein